MVFSSLTFLWIFLPVILGIYYSFSFIRNEKLKMMLKNISLLIFSLIFYAGGGINYVLIMISSITFNYFFALLITKLKAHDKEQLKKWVLICAITVNIGILVYFKYTNLLIDMFNNLTKLNFEIMDIVLPIGISFFTFQSMSYVIDVYTSKAECQKNYINLALYVSFFPQLIAGPIVKYSDVNQQIEGRKETIDKFTVGIKRFLYGLAKKVIIANTMGLVAETILGNEIGHLDSIAVWVGVICYAVQIYYDFSGYSDMAIGLGKMFGFDFVENFNYPYMATSIRDFWRRWHISLSSWFKEYVYIPLGGNRRGKFRTYLNLFIVFLLTGIWHGANYTFLVWGIAFGVFMVIERLFLGDLLDRNKFKIINRIYTLFVVLILWIFFRAENISVAIQTIKMMFSFTKNVYPVAQNVSLAQWAILVIGILLAGPIQKLFGNIYLKIKDKEVFIWVDYTWQFILYFVCVNLLINNSFNPFIYFQF